MGTKFNHAQETIIRLLSQKMYTAEGLSKELGKGYTELKVQSMVLALARKGAIDKTRAALLLHGSPMIRLLSYTCSSNLKGAIPAPSDEFGEI